MIRAPINGSLKSRLIEGQQPTYGLQLEGFLRVLPEMELPKQLSENVLSHKLYPTRPLITEPNPKVYRAVTDG